MLRTTLLSLSLVLATAGLARASQYPVDGIPELISQSEAAQLKAGGVATTQQLLDRGATAKGRKDLAKATKMPARKLRDLVNASDLMRVRGIGPKMVRLLGHLKIRTLAALAKQDPAKLAVTVEKARPKLAPDLKEKLPDQTTLADWIAQAKALPAMVR